MMSVGLMSGNVEFRLYVWFVVCMCCNVNGVFE